MAPQLTARGAATRARIVESAAEQVLAGGVGGTSLDDIRADTETSKSQLFHYFPGGKSELVGAIASFQADRVLAAQEPYLSRLATWDDWRGLLEAGVARLRDAGELSPDADPRALSLAVFASLQGGLLLTATAESIEPLEAALDGALAMLRAA